MLSMRNKNIWGTLIIFISIVFFSIAKVNAQSDFDSRLLNHYSPEDLTFLQANDSVKFNTISYYYTQSYFVEIVPCNQCVVTDTATFDIWIYESLRKQNERVVKIVKYGIKLTLLATDELIYLMPFQQ